MSVSFDCVSAIYDATRGLPPNVSEQVTDCILRLASATPATQFLEQPQYEFKQRWDEILAHYGVELTDYGATEADVLDALTQQGATIETIVAAEWRIEQTIDELLHRYQNRMYSASWQIPDEIFALAIQNLTTWCEQHYDSLDLDVSHNTRFQITIAPLGAVNSIRLRSPF
ncbi:MAG: hypothetical protein KME45_30540 [Stenomitos rutilans HA7619-LM2]|nr:hypothetical protein [Stenomitos rutilans HA7619-LM2]